MNILVTGANGQLGNEVCTVSIGSINRYLFTDITELDITQLVSIRKMVTENAIDVIVNCAAYTDVHTWEACKQVKELSLTSSRLKKLERIHSDN